MKKKILTIAFLALFALPARAGTIGNFFGRAFENAKYALSCGNNDLYVPVRTWHNRLFYDQEHIDKYNEEPWGIGFGRSFWEGNEWHGVYAMAFQLLFGNDCRLCLSLQLGPGQFRRLESRRRLHAQPDPAGRIHVYPGSAAAADCQPDIPASVIAGSLHSRRQKRRQRSVRMVEMDFLTPR